MHLSRISPERRLIKSVVATTVLAGLSAAVLAPGPAQAGAHTPGRAHAPVQAPLPARAQVSAGAYVALGDSMAAGPLIPNPTGPLACGRSTRNYPHELATRLGAGTLRDVTCSGAKTTHMTQPQSLSILDVPAGTAPPQLDALRADTTLVTLTIGGNDAGLVGVAEDCARLDPTATPCKEEYTQGGVDRVAERIDAFEPKLSAVLDGIRARSPQAHVVVTGYGLYIKPRGCWPTQPVLPTDADYLQGSVARLNGVIQRQTIAHGGTYIDLVTPSVGHDACQSASRRWIEGYVPVNPAAPLHPNRAGEANYARIIAERIGTDPR